MQVPADREIDMLKLQDELQAAGFEVPALGRYGALPYGETLHTYDSEGNPLDLPADALAVVEAHSP